LSFCTAISCIDGRVHLPLISFMQRRFGVRYVDLVNEPGVVAVLSREPDSQRSAFIFSKVDVSVSKHAPKAIAIVAHDDCAGNPVSEREQRRQLSDSYRQLKARYPDQSLYALWIDKNWTVHEVSVEG
jgi:carbonic anhydrase